MVSCKLSAEYVTDDPVSEQFHKQFGSGPTAMTHKPSKEPPGTSTVWRIELLSAVEFIRVARDFLVFLYSAMIVNMFTSVLTLSFLLPHPGVWLFCCLGLVFVLVFGLWVFLFPPQIRHMNSFCFIYCLCYPPILLSLFQVLLVVGL